MHTIKSGRSISLLAIAILLTGILLVFAPSVQAEIPPGIPREDLLIIGTATRSAIADDYNGWRPGNQNVAIGVDRELLWVGNTTSQAYEPLLASSPAQYSDNFTTLRISARQGIYWTDGVEFTAEDIVFTVNLHLNVSGLIASSYIKTWVQNAYTEDKYTAVIKLKKSAPLFHLTSFPPIIPRHIWEKVADPIKYTNNPPVGTGLYVIQSFDPNGFWVLFKLRDDWERSAAGKLYGKPKPKYLLRIFYEPTDSKQVIAISKHELDIAEVTTDMLDVVKKANPSYTGTTWNGFPYAWQRGSYDRGTTFNLDKYPYNITEVRWALALSTDITELNINALNGMGRISTFRSLSKPDAEKYYVPTLLPWLKNFSLSDGYKPFDDTVPYRLADWAKSQGITLSADPIRVWGYGWWKYDTQEAEKLLKNKGFSRDSAGKWRLPNGELWTIKMIISADDPFMLRYGFGLLEQWKKFGINVIEETPTDVIMSKRYNQGDFEVIGGGEVFSSDFFFVWPTWQRLHERYYKPSGNATSSNQIRWVNHRVSALLDELGTLPPEDPKVITITSEILKISYEEMPVINGFIATRTFVYDNYVWTNYPTEDNLYWDGWPTSSYYMIPIMIERASKVSSSDKDLKLAPVSDKDLTPATPAEPAIVSIIMILAAELVFRRKKLKSTNSIDQQDDMEQ